MMCQLVLNGAVIRMNRLVVGLKQPFAHWSAFSETGWALAGGLRPQPARHGCRCLSASLQAFLRASPFHTVTWSLWLIYCKMLSIPHLARSLPAPWFEIVLLSAAKEANGTRSPSPLHHSALHIRSPFLLLSQSQVMLVLPYPSEVWWAITS